MFRKLCFVPLALLLLFSLAACAERPLPDQVGFTEDCLYAIAYLGVEEPSSVLSPYRERYNLPRDMPTYYFPGQECYLILPKEPEMHLSIWELAMGENGKTQETLRYGGPAGSAFVVQGNLSDIFPNMRISLSKQKGLVSCSFSPYLSGEDGEMVLGEGAMLLPAPTENS